MGWKDILLPNGKGANSSDVEDYNDIEGDLSEENEGDERLERRNEIEEQLRKYNVFSEPYNKWHDKWMDEFGGSEA